jgi:hypothetical protein
MAEAVEWVKRCPNPMPGPSEIEIRPLYEITEFGDAVTPELARQGSSCARRSPSAELSGRRRLPCPSLLS